AVRVEDGRGGVAAQTWRIAIGPKAANRPPVITSTPSLRTEVDQTYRYETTATDPEGDELTFALVQSPHGMSIDPAPGVGPWRPGAAQLGDREVLVAAHDPAGNVAFQGFFARVRPANRPPAITSTPATAGTPGQAYRYDVGASDPEGDPLTFTLAAGPQGM